MYGYFACVHRFMHHMHAWFDRSPETRVPGSCDLPRGVLGIKPRSSRVAAGAPDCSAISPAHVKKG